MLTPLDIHNKEFKKSLRGYDIDEVDEFLDEVIRDFEVIYKENLELKEVIKKKDENIKHYQALEETLRNTMVLAQQTADEAKQNATKEAELIIWEAKKKAEQILNDVQQETLNSMKKIEEMKSIEKQLYMKMKNFLQTQLEYITNYEWEKQEQDEPKDDESEV